jgi:hypothetical protein
MTIVQFDEFTTAYLEAALWSSSDESNDAGGEPMDKSYSRDDIDFASLARMLEDCAKFQACPEWQCALDAGVGAYPGAGRYSIEEQGGHDFWLTRNGHGAGFWDGDWSEPYGDALDKLSKHFGEVYLYVGDDGKIHQS